MSAASKPTISPDEDAPLMIVKSVADERAARRLKSAVHWALIRHREPITSKDRMDDDQFVDMQALNCPHYVPLEGEWGMDWGAIMHPSSAKFGQLVFEHEWCGCHFHDPAYET